MLTHFKNRIEQLTYMELQTEAQKGSKSGWNGRGFADIAIDRQNSAPNFTRLRETGCFYLNDGKKLPFNNTFKFVWSRDKVTLYHERFGVDNAVWLFYFIIINERTLASAAPHICINDYYQATLEINTQGINVLWRIKGPRKNELLTYQYFINKPDHY